jgi:hypothetical protein
MREHFHGRMHSPTSTKIILDGHYGCVDRIVIDATCPAWEVAAASGVGGARRTGLKTSSTTKLGDSARGALRGIETSYSYW